MFLVLKGAGGSGGHVDAREIKELVSATRPSIVVVPPAPPMIESAVSIVPPAAMRVETRRIMGVDPFESNDPQACFTKEGGFCILNGVNGLSAAVKVGGLSAEYRWNVSIVEELVHKTDDTHTRILGEFVFSRGSGGVEYGIHFDVRATLGERTRGAHREVLSAEVVWSGPFKK
jgi:hypothetical protein